MNPVTAQAYKLPSRESYAPIVLIGAGGIVQSAHLPAYQRAGYSVAGLFDLDQAKARQTAALFSIPFIYTSMAQAVASAPPNSVFDVAVPGHALLNTLDQLPDSVTVLMQKPMGETLQQAEAIVALCQRKKLLAGVNFQLRYAPFMLTARKIIQEGLIGQVCDIEVNVNVYTPWQLWSFLSSAPRLEILYHSIHYIDWIRQLMGEPVALFARSIRHPNQLSLSSVKSSLYLDYGDTCRATILTNHNHTFGPDLEQSYIVIEGTKGAIRIDLGVLKNYPNGQPDLFRYVLLSDDKSTGWQVLTMKGSWFPDAFVGSMGEMLKAQGGEITQPDNSVQDCLKTMQLVEIAYQSNLNGFRVCPS